MNAEQQLMGFAIAAVCALGLFKLNWLITETRKGKWCAERWGESRARIIWGTVLMIGGVSGVLLATGMIQPVRWNAP